MSAVNIYDFSVKNVPISANAASVVSVWPTGKNVKP
jgi:hypothetical protein